MKFVFWILFVWFSFMVQIVTAGAAAVGFIKMVGGGWWWFAWTPMLLLHGISFQAFREEMEDWLLK